MEEKKKKLLFYIYIMCSEKQRIDSFPLIICRAFNENHWKHSIPMPSSRRKYDKITGEKRVPKKTTPFSCFH